MGGRVEDDTLESMSMLVAVDEDPKMEVVKEGMNGRESSVLVEVEGRGTETVKSPVGTAVAAAACLACRACRHLRFFRCL